MRKLLVAVMLIFSGATLAQEAPGKVLEAAVNQVIRPAMSAFAEKAGVLEGSVAALCSDPSAEGLETAHDAFADAAIAYGHVEFIRIGPLMEDNRAERLLFFPIARGLGCGRCRPFWRMRTLAPPMSQACGARASRCRGLERWSSSCTARVSTR